MLSDIAYLSSFISQGISKLYFYVANKPIEHDKSFLHFGHSFTSEFNEYEDIINGRSNFVRHRNNSLC